MRGIDDLDRDAKPIMGQTARPVEILSNTNLSRHSTTTFRFSFEQGLLESQAPILRTVMHLLRMERTIDAILVFHGDAKPWAALALYRLVGGSAHIFSFDLVLPTPTTAAQRIRAVIKGLLLRAARIHICVHKDTSGYEKHYGLQRKKIVYVPFKSNCYEIRHDLVTTEGDYVLSCGASYRDYDTLLAALRGTNVPAKIVLPSVEMCRFHNTKSSLANPPPNVEVVRHDPRDRDLWYRYLANARLVVVPIDANAIQSAGISVYLEAMSLGKAVIISDSPATRGILTGDMACIVPPGDPDSLKRCILTLYGEEAARRSYAESGRRYAESLGGVLRLGFDLGDTISRAIGQCRKRRA